MELHYVYVRRGDGPGKRTNLGQARGIEKGGFDNWADALDAAFDAQMGTPIDVVTGEPFSKYFIIGVIAGGVE